MHDKWDQLLKQLASSLGVLCRERLIMPYLMMFYASIDIFAYVYAGGDDTKSGERFRSFCDKYITVNLDGAKSADLWGARCSILHTASPGSTHSRKGRARELLYSWGTGSVKINQKVIAESCTPEKYWAVSIESLEMALCNGMESFAQDLLSDPVLNKMCMDRVNKSYSMIPVPKRLAG